MVLQLQYFEIFIYFIERIISQEYCVKLKTLKLLHQIGCNFEQYFCATYTR